MRVEQVQEKKVKKVSDYNVDPSKAVGNGSTASSSNSSSLKAYLANGGSPERPSSSLGGNLSLPAEGISSLHLPVVVVLYPLTSLYDLLTAAPFTISNTRFGPRSLSVVVVS